MTLIVGFLDAQIHVDGDGCKMLLADSCWEVPLTRRDIWATVHLGADRTSMLLAWRGVCISSASCIELLRFLSQFHDLSHLWGVGCLQAGHGLSRRLLQEFESGKVAQANPQCKDAYVKRTSQWPWAHSWAVLVGIRGRISDSKVTTPTPRCHPLYTLYIVAMQKESRCAHTHTHKPTAHTHTQTNLGV